MLNSLNTQSQNYQFQHGQNFLNYRKKNEMIGDKYVVGLEKGSLQSHETNSQLGMGNANGVKKNSLEYGRLINNSRSNLVSANSLQGNTMNGFLNAFMKVKPVVKPNSSGASYQESNIEGMGNVEPLQLNSNDTVTDENLTSLKNLENKFNNVLSTYITTYKTMSEDVISRHNKLKGVSQYFGKSVSDSGNQYYVNNYGYTHKYVADSWEKNDDSCPSDLVNIASNELEILQDSVNMVSGQPCKLAGKNIKKRGVEEYAWVDIKGVKHVYSDDSWTTKQKSCDINVVELSSDKYDSVPTGNNMTSTTVCDQLGVNPEVWNELSSLNKELISISKKIQTEMSNLRTQDSNFKKEIKKQKKLLSQYVTTLEKEKEMIDNQEEGMDMATVTGSYDDSILNRRQKNYRYLAWSFVALTGGAFLVRQLVNGRN